MSIQEPSMFSVFPILRAKPGIHWYKYLTSASEKLIQKVCTPNYRNVGLFGHNLVKLKWQAQSAS